MKTMSIEQHFTANADAPGLGNDEISLTEPDGYSYDGAVGETSTEFVNYCNASRIIEEADLSYEQMEAIAVLMNRAAAYGRQLAKLEND